MDDPQPIPSPTVTPEVGPAPDARRSRETFRKLAGSAEGTPSPRTLTAVIWATALSAVVAMLVAFVAWSTGTPGNGLAVMPPNAAVAIAVLAITVLGVSARVRWARATVVIPGLLAISALVAHATTTSTIEVWAPGARSAASEGLMSIQTALLVLLSCVVLIVDGITNRRARHVTLTLTAVLLVAVGMVIIAKAWGADALIGQSSDVFLSVPTAVGMGLVTAAWVARCARDLAWRRYTSRGVAGTAFRKVLLVAIAGLMLLAVILRLLTSEVIDISPEAAVAMTLTGGIILILAVAERTFRKVSVLEETIVELAGKDALTGQWNVLAFDELGSALISGAQRSGDALCMTVLDIDGLKDVNDRLGHRQGSRLIQVVAAAIAGEARDEDLVARLGGDEFAIIARIDPDDAMQMAERIRSAAVARAAAEGAPWTPRISFGVAAINAGEDTLYDALHVADERMYEDKARRKRVD